MRPATKTATGAMLYSMHRGYAPENQALSPIYGWARCHRENVGSEALGHDLLS